MAHVAGGVRWAAGELSGDCNSTLDSYWEKQTVDSYAINVMSFPRLMH